MDTSIHFSEVLGLLAVLAGTGAWVWAIIDRLQRRHNHRRARVMLQEVRRA